MKYISLTQEQYALVDDEDYEHLNQWKWSAVWSKYTKSYYAYGNLGSMHRVIMNSTSDRMIDHKNHNTLDNQRKNLRVCTRTQNFQNKISYKNNKSGYKGVYLQGSKWRVQIRLNNKKIHIGMFDNIIDAAKAYDTFAKDLFGEFAYLNFPD